MAKEIAASKVTRSAEGKDEATVKLKYLEKKFGPEFDEKYTERV